MSPSWSRIAISVAVWVTVSSWGALKSSARGPWGSRLDVGVALLPAARPTDDRRPPARRRLARSHRRRPHVRALLPHHSPRPRRPRCCPGCGPPWTSASSAGRPRCPGRSASNGRKKWEGLRLRGPRPVRPGPCVRWSWRGRRTLNLSEEGGCPQPMAVPRATRAETACFTVSSARRCLGAPAQTAPHFELRPARPSFS